MSEEYVSPKVRRMSEATKGAGMPLIGCGTGSGNAIGCNSGNSAGGSCSTPGNSADSCSSGNSP